MNCKGIFKAMICACMAISLGACSKQNKQDSDVSETPAEKTVVDVLDREVKLSEEVNKVVVTFNLEEVAAACGEGWNKKLVGWSRAYWEGRREDAWKTWTTAFPELETITDIGYNDGLNIETIISLEPDVIIASAAVNKDFFDAQQDKLDAAGIPVVYVNFHKQTPEMHRKSMEALGQSFNQQKRADEIASYCEEQLGKVTEIVAKIPETDRPNVYMEFSMGPNQFGNTWSTRMWGALIETCGGVNIAKDLGDSNSVEIAPEAILAADPDVIIFTASPRTDVSDNIVLGYGADEKKALTNLEAYRSRTGWSDLAAVKNNRMGALYHDLSRHIFDFAGAQFLVKMIQPDAAADLDPLANLKEFYQKYMPVELDGAWMVSLQ